MEKLIMPPDNIFPKAENDQIPRLELESNKNLKVAWDGRTYHEGI